MTDLLAKAPQGSYADFMEADISIEMEALADIFDHIDKDSSGTLNDDEICKLFDDFGLVLEKKHARHLSPRSSRHEIVKSVFGPLSKGGIDKKEFLLFMYAKQR